MKDPCVDLLLVVLVGRVIGLQSGLIPIYRDVVLGRLLAIIPEDCGCRNRIKSIQCNIQSSWSEI